MYANPVVPHAQTASRPRTVPVIVTGLVHVALLLLLANGLGVVSFTSTPDPFTVVAIPSSDPPPIPREQPVMSPDALTIPEPKEFLPPDIPLERDPVVVTLTDNPPIDAEPVQQSGQVAVYEPRLLRKTDPDYPMQARRSNEQGVVLVQLTISTQGRVVQARVKASSGYRRLDQAALESVRHWLFAPARRGTRAIEYSIDAPIRFELNEIR